MVAGMRLRPKYEFPTLQLIDIYEVAFVGLFPKRGFVSHYRLGLTNF